MDRTEWVGRKGAPILRTQVYDSFTAGEFSLLSGVHAPVGSFESLNMIVYKDGLLGPRHGIKNLGVTGVRTDAGGVIGLGWRGTPGADLWWIQDTLVFSIDSRTIGDAATQWITGLDFAPTATPQWVEYGTQFTYLTSYADKTYKLDHVATDLVPLAGSPGGRSIAFYGDRMCVANNGTNFNRVFISAVNDPDDWTGGEFFDIPNQSGSVVSLWVQRNHLTIWTANGEWWTVTGAAGTTAAFLRRISGGGQHPWIACQNRGAALASDDILHLPTSVDTPARFDGATTTVLDYMAINNQESPANETQIKILRGMRPDEGVVVFPNTQRFGVFYNGQWTFHKFDPVTGPSGITQFCASDMQGQIMFADDGPGSPAPQFYTWTMNAVEHPGFSTSPLSSPGDDSNIWFNAYVNLPEWWAPDGYNVRVRRVIVDLKEWDSGADVPNAYTVTCRSLSKYEDPGYTDGPTRGYSAFPTGPWDGAVGDSHRLRHVHRFGPGNIYGGGFQIRISGIGGVAFQAIRVDYQLEPSVPRE